MGSARCGWQARGRRIYHRFSLDETRRINATPRHLWYCQIVKLKPRLDHPLIRRLMSNKRPLEDFQSSAAKRIKRYCIIFLPVFTRPHLHFSLSESVSVIHAMQGECLPAPLTYLSITFISPQNILPTTSNASVSKDTYWGPPSFWVTWPIIANRWCPHCAKESRNRGQTGCDDWEEDNRRQWSTA